jgi:hypothetical protein
MISRILDTIAVQILPPTTTQISRLTRTELGLTVRDVLESALHRQWVLDNEGVVVEPLAGHVYDARRAVSES